MADNPAAVNRPLDEQERDLLSELIVWKIRHNIGQQGIDVDQESTVDALEDLNNRHGLYREYDAQHLYINVGGDRNKVILHCTREWLAFHAHHGEPITEDELQRAISKGDIE